MSYVFGNQNIPLLPKPEVSVLVSTCSFTEFYGGTFTFLNMNKMKKPGEPRRIYHFTSERSNKQRVLRFEV